MHKDAGKRREYQRAYAAKRRQEHPDETRARMAAWRAEHPEALARYAERRATAHDSFERNLALNYGITPEDYARMYEAQGHRCAICGDPLTLDTSTHVDHDHETGKVRGLLCVTCNVAVGMLKESFSRALSLAGYLLKHS